MSKTKRTKELLISSAIAGLLMSGTSLASMHQAASQSHQFFKVQELKSGYQLAKKEKAETPVDAAAEKNCNGKDKTKNCCDNSTKEKHEKESKSKSSKEKSCQGKEKDSHKEKEVKEMTCGEGTCGTKEKK